MSSGHEESQNSGHRIPRFLRALGHGPGEHAAHDRGGGEQQNEYTAHNVELDVLSEELSASRTPSVRSPN